MTTQPSIQPFTDPFEPVPLRDNFYQSCSFFPIPFALITSGMVLAVFTLINLALIRITRREPVPEGVEPCRWPCRLSGCLRVCLSWWRRS